MGEAFRAPATYESKKRRSRPSCLSTTWHGPRQGRPRRRKPFYVSFYSNFFHLSFYLPPAWSEPELFAAFQAYGTIVSARVQRDAFGRSRGYGFISYDTSDSAQGAIRGMDGAAVGGKRLKVSIKKGDSSSDENPMLRKFSRTASLLVGFQ